LEIDYNKYNIFIFDLDKTLWDTSDKYGQSIWAKQMIPPFRSEGNTVRDDVDSLCRLRDGVLEYLNFLSSKNMRIGFLSSGFLWGTAYESQPSIKMLELFNIIDFFNFKKDLLYKTEPKVGKLEDVGECVFFDDNDNVIARASEMQNIRVIDSKDSNSSSI